MKCPLTSMTQKPRERILAAMDFRPPDIIPLQIHPALGGLYEHGQKLVDLIRSCGHDFGDLNSLELPEPPGTEDFDPDGRYHAIKTDAWGTTWEYRIFGIWGHPIAWPLNDLNKLKNYTAPPVAPTSGSGFEAAKAAADTHRQEYFLLGNGDMLFERMRALRRFEYVLMDIADDTPEINRIADIILESDKAHVHRSLMLDVDGVAFGDDLGTQNSLMISPTAFRQFFKPRYRELFEPIFRANKHICFHSCGEISSVLEDLREVGVDSIWPQLSLYDLPELAKRCGDLGISVQLHPDRGDLMQRGTPEEIHDYVCRLMDTFDTANGGSWLYIEIDPGFPYANVEALFDSAMELRKC
ncbi:uroporphyrinogen decarboxylase family protein, partial [Candidatus Poribacteria bacterium]